MLRISDIKLGTDDTESDLRKKVLKLLGVKNVKSFEISKKSIDARKKPDIHYVYSVDVETDNEEYYAKKMMKQTYVINGICCLVVILTMPETMSLERRNILKIYGAEIVLTDGAKGMSGAIEEADRLAKEIDNSFLAGQFVNPANPKAHLETTGPEIWEDTDGEVDYFIAGVGTGGTITGVGEYLKSKKPDVKIIAIEPETSAVLSGGKAGPHKIQGIGAGFIPETLHADAYDSVVTVNNEDAFTYAKLIARQEGILVGISSGAALQVAVDLAKKPENKGKTIVALLPDSGDRYYSTPLFDD